MDWDSGPIYQSPRGEVYRNAVERLLAEGKAYPCICTRREVELAASAPHAEDGAAVYPGTCRGKFKTMEEAEAAAGGVPLGRFAGPAGTVEIGVGVAGPVRIEPAEEVGDFVKL